jgi:hypothetical protein
VVLGDTYLNGDMWLVLATHERPLSGNSDWLLLVKAVAQVVVFPTY